MEKYLGGWVCRSLDRVNTIGDMPILELRTVAAAREGLQLPL
jgi:hypothetical protein